MFDLKNIRHDYDGKAVLSLTAAGAQGQHWLLLGNSGSGKTTLLHIMAGLLKPTSGQVTIGEKNLAEFSGRQLDRFRGQHIGIVFQQMHLLPTLTVQENLMLAPYLAGIKPDRKRITEVLESLNIAEKARAYPHTLSFGQQQRVAIARAVMNRPKIILADEPTAALDDKNSENVLKLMLTQAEQCQATLVIATHDQRIKKYFDHQINLDDMEKGGQK